MKSPGNRPNRIRSIARVASIILMAASLASDLFMPRPGPGIGFRQASVALLALVAFLSTFGSASRFIAGKLPIIAMNAILLFLLLDALALAVENRLASAARMETVIAIAEPVPAYDTVELPPGCFHPFVTLRLEPSFSKPGVTSDSLGFRTTPGNDGSEEAIEIHVYGGSTVLGWALPDSCALPAMIQERLRSMSSVPLNVRNRGIATRNSTQSFFEFILDVQAGRVPDAAIFYEGYNDGATAWYETDPSSHLGARRIRDLFCTGDSTTGPGHFFIEDMALFTLSASLAGGRSDAPVLLEGGVPLGRSSDPHRLAFETVRIFSSNCRQIRAAAGAFDIPVIIAWQPCLAAEQRLLGPCEAQFLDDMDDGEVEFQRILRDSSLAGSESGLYAWLGDATTCARSAVFMDYCHMNAEGNRLMAGEIVSLLDSTGGCAAWLQDGDR